MNEDGIQSERKKKREDLTSSSSSSLSPSSSIPFAQIRYERSESAFRSHLAPATGILRRQQSNKLETVEGSRRRRPVGWPRSGVGHTKRGHEIG